MVKRFLRYPAVAAVVLVGLACGAAGIVYGNKPDYQAEMEKISDQIATKLTAAVPYPIGLMNDSLERRGIRERLLRFNQANKTGYLYLFNLGVEKPIGYYVIKGKVSATQSQLSNPDQTWNTEASGNSDYGAAAESIGDDGSFGTDEGGEAGIFFFDANGVMHETTLPWSYSDGPNPLWTDVPNYTKGADGPSSTSEVWEKNGGGLGGR